MYAKCYWYKNSKSIKCPILRFFLTLHACDILKFFAGGLLQRNLQDVVTA